MVTENSRWCWVYDSFSKELHGETFLNVLYMKYREHFGKVWCLVIREEKSKQIFDAEFIDSESRGKNEPLHQPRTHTHRNRLTNHSKTLFVETLADMAQATVGRRQYF